jgi:glucose/arabinose dehydrogenase
LGLAVDRHGVLWGSENGPRGGDELNVLRGGRNYGWPVITWGHRYDGRAVSANPTQKGMEQPVVSWVPSPAVSAIAFYTGDAFVHWRNDLFVGTLKQRDLLRIVLDGDRAVAQETILHNVDRFRDVATGPDGYLYVLTDNGSLLRLVPADESRDAR